MLSREAGSARDGMSDSGETIAQSYAKDPTSFTKVGNYYYRFIHDQSACAPKVVSSLSAAQNTANDFVKALLSGLQAASLSL